MKQFIPSVRLAPASVPAADSILANRNQNKKARDKLELLYFGGRLIHCNQFSWTSIKWHYPNGFSLATQLLPILGRKSLKSPFR